MLDLENVKSMLQRELINREQAKADWNEHFNDTYFSDPYFSTVYEKTYIKYRSRFNAMCDLLFEMDYLVFIDDDNSVRVEKRNGDNITTYVPF